MSMQDDILEVIKRGGPQVAPRIAKELKGDALIISAMLSELKASGKVKISQMKIGTSPLYYLPGQEKRLTLFADRLNNKDRAVFDKLEQLKVLREAQLDLLGKVALRKMKDFAIPLQVSVGGKKEIFWRWFMLSPGETNLIVSSLLQQVGPSDTVEEITSEGLFTPALNHSNVDIKKSVPTTTSNQNISTTQSSSIAPVANVSSTNQVKKQRIPTADELARAAKAATSAAAVSPSSVQASPPSSLSPSSSSQLSSESDLKNPWGTEYPPNTTVRDKSESVYPTNTAGATSDTAIFEDTMQSHVIEVVNTADIDSITPGDVYAGSEESEQIKTVESPKPVESTEEIKVKEPTADIEEKVEEVKSTKEIVKEPVKQSEQEQKKSVIEEKKVISESPAESNDEKKIDKQPNNEGTTKEKGKEELTSLSKQVEVEDTKEELSSEKELTKEEETVSKQKTLDEGDSSSDDTKSKEVSESKVSTAESKEKQKSLMEKLKETFLPKRKGKAGALLPKVEDFLKKQDIVVESSEVIRKNSDLSLQILVPTKVGKVLFFCKVRNKKKCDEKDISAAYMEAQVAKLPLLFIYTDEVSPKATEFLESGSFDNLLLMKLEVE